MREVERESPEFSLIVSTVGRPGELDGVLESVAGQTVGQASVEVIVVDQSDGEEVRAVVEKWVEKLNVVYIRDEGRGASRGRNIGLGLARGRIVGFPDDDCKYYPDTLENVRKVFEESVGVNLVVGRVVDRRLGQSLIRRWPAKRKRINRLNFFTHYTAVSIFARSRLRFDERLGGGTHFGAYEDADFVYRMLLGGGIAIYEPGIEVWHPQRNVATYTEEQIRAYGRGFGALVRKHLSLVMMWWLLGVVMYHGWRLLYACIRGDRHEARKRWVAIAARLEGLWSFPSGRRAGGGAGR